MAKIGELKFNLNGKDWKLPINVGVDGVFKCKIPGDITDKLKIRNELRHSTLQALETEFYTAFNKYLNSETTYQFYIAIRYGACGDFVPENRAGHKEFGHYTINRKYHLDVSFGNVNGMSLNYNIVCLEKIDGIEEWYLAIQDDITKELFKGNNKFYERDKYKLIDYNEVSLETLHNAHLKIKSLSRLLYDFIEQDKEQIELLLSQGKLLLNQTTN